jgi:hypothetical protein
MDIDFVSPKNASFTNVGLGYMSLPTPLIADDIATKGYVDALASSGAGAVTQGTYSYTFTGMAESRAVVQMHYYKMGNMVVLTTSTGIQFTGNGQFIRATDTTPALIKPIITTAMLPCTVSADDGETTSATMATFEIGDGYVTVRRNGLQTFESLKIYLVSGFPIYTIVPSP